MRVTFTMTRLSIAATALLAVAGAGCGDLQSIAQDILDHHSGASDGGTSSDGSRPTDGGRSTDGSLPTGCFLNGVQYAEGDSFPKDDCNICYCKAGSFTCASSGKCGGTGVPPVCKDFTFAPLAECVSVDKFQAIAQEACSQQKLVLSGVKLDSTCDGKTARAGRYSCCDPNAGSPPPQYCEKIADTVGTSCVDQSSYKEHGIQACASRGLTLTDLVIGQACGTEKQGASSVTFVCCGPTPPKPVPPPECTRVDGGGGVGSCKPASTWKSYGAEACAALGMALSDLAFASACSQTGSDYENAIYTCCGGSPPVPTGKCGVEITADGSECKSCWDAAGVKVSSSCAALPTK